MTRSVRWILLALIFVIPVSVSSPVVAEGEPRYRRSVEVATPGWVAVAVDDRVLRHSAVDLELRSPNGESLPFGWWTPPETRRPVTVEDVRKQDDSWALTLDLGSSPPRHSRLHFEVDRDTVAEGCRLEVQTVEGWRTLTEGNLFRLGEDDGLVGLVLDYAPTDARRLRLLWPTSALPVLRRVEVEVFAGEGRTLDAPVSCMDLRSGNAGSRGSAVRCRVSLPGLSLGLQRLDLELESPVTGLGYRVRMGAEERWSTLSEGTLSEADTLHLPLTVAGAGARELRVDLRSGGGESPQLRRAVARLEPRNLAFEARTPGTHRLVYGHSSAVVSKQRLFFAVPSSAQVARLSAGEEEAGPWPPWPERATAPLVDLPEMEVHGKWPVIAEAEPGDVIRMPLTPEVWIAAGFDLRKLRLATSEPSKQVPFVRRTLPEPGSLDVEPVRQASSAAGHSLYRVPLDPSPPVTEVWLRARGPFERKVEIKGPQSATRPGVDNPRPRWAGPSRWSCQSPGPLPCELRLGFTTATGLVRPKGGDLEIDVSDGDNPPLEDLEVELTFRRDEILFVWPGEPVDLVVGHGSRAPRYDLGSLAPMLTLRPAVHASLGDRASVDEGPVEGPRWVLPLVLVLAAAVLLVILGRLIGDRRP
ncbi:MAG: hypothetical protein AAGD06_00020 [Acidobacteriota bacterium]